MRAPLVASTFALVGACCFAPSPAPAPSVLGAAVPVPADARLLCTSATTSGAFALGEAYAPLADRVARGAGGPLQFTSYVMPAPLLGDSMNIAQAFFIEHLGAARDPFSFFQAGGADRVIGFAGPSTPGSAGYATRPWFVELYRGVRTPHVFGCGTEFGTSEVLIVIATPPTAASATVP